jgi:hypothetical protein
MAKATTTPKSRMNMGSLKSTIRSAVKNGGNAAKGKTKGKKSAGRSGG